MCGIAGEISTAAPAHDPAAAVATMVGAMAHRGPDANGVKTSANATLGMCRLAIIDIEDGQQPMRSDDGRYTIVYNGECYNCDELRAALAAKGVTLTTKSDTEVVLYSYTIWGRASLDRLNGMFAFAIWDRDEGSLFLARDRMGIKPLYYSLTNGRLLFASTLNAIRRHPAFKATVDPEAVELFLTCRYIPGPRTIFCDVRKLPAGHWASFKNGQLEIQQWWDIPLMDERPSRTLDDAGEELASLLESASRARLVSERQLGLSLSGGIDSGLLAATLGQEQLSAFSMGFENDAFDETDLAAEVAAQYNLSHHILKGDYDVEADFNATVAHYDEPNGDSSAMALYALSRLLAEHVTVVLSGTGGDELFGGYMRYVAGNLAPIAAKMPGMGLVPKVFGNDTDTLPGKLAHFAESANLPPEQRHMRYYNLLPPEQLEQLKRPEFKQRVAGFSAADLFKPYWQRTEGQSTLTRLQYFDMKSILVDDYLVKEDRMTMAHSIEARVPFLDHRVVELAMSLPDNLKLKGTQTKRLLRHLAAQKLPKAVVKAPKHGFTVPVGDWLRGPLRERMSDELGTADACVNEFVDAGYVRGLIDAHLEGSANHKSSLWPLLCLESWLRGIGDGRE